MELAGICGVCNRGTRTLYTCWRCGTIVCNSCFDAEAGLCVRCSPRGKRWK